MSSEHAIGLFDSGIGGLTVLRAVRSALPTENFVYLGDTARLPYGSKSPETIYRYLQQNIDYLIKHGVKAIVVACNSASSVIVGRTDLNFSIPVYNVIEPGAKKALEATKNKRIGVLGTRATVAGGAYDRAIHALDPSAEVISQACPLLVPLVEEGWDEDPLTNLIVYRYLHPLLMQGIDTLIMGCTHYPALKESFRRVVGPNVELIDSAETIASMIREDLERSHIPIAKAGQGHVDILVTDTSPTFQGVAERLMRPFPLKPLTQVDLT
jgi:glutamate racemase